MNIFNKIENYIEESKQKKKQSEEKYWRLSAIERIDYDNKRDRILKNEYTLFSLTILIAKVFFYSIIFIGILSFFSERLDLFIPFGLLTIKLLFSILPLLLLFEFVIMVLDYMDTNKQYKELKKRFKL